MASIDLDNADASTATAEQSTMSTPIRQHPASAATPLLSSNPFFSNPAPTQDANHNQALTGERTTPYVHRSALLTQAHNPPVLKGSDTFAVFKRKAEALLVSYGRYYIVQDVNVPLTSTSVRRVHVVAPPVANYPYRNEDRRDVWGFLYQALDDGIIANFTPEALDPIAADAAMLWKEMHEKFDRTDIQSAGEAHGKLWSTKLKEGGDAQKHINEMQGFYNKLTIAGNPPSDTTYATALLLSLPHQYETLKSNKFADPYVTSHGVKNAIVTEWERLGYPGRNGEKGDSEDAKAFFSKPEAKGKERDVRKKYCTEHPNASTHDTKDCFALKRSETRKKDQELEDLRKQLAELKAASAKVAVAEDPFPEVGLGEEPGDKSTGYVAVSSSALIAKSVDNTAYVIDSGATEHMVCTDKDLHDKVPFSHAIRTAGNHFIPVTHKGILRVGNLVLKDVLYAPGLGFNLLSVHKLAQDGYAMSFKSNRCSVTDEAGNSVLDIQGDGLYSIKASDSAFVAQTNSADALFYLHRSLAHLNWLGVVKLAKSGRLGSKWENLELVKNVNILCEPCTLGKAHRQPSPPSNIRALNANDIAHVDIFGPTRTVSLGGHSYILACYDDHTHRIQLYFLRSKKEATSAFKQYLNLVKNQCGSSVKLVRSDNGGEFTAEVFLDLLAAEGIVAQRIPPAAHAQNGRVERVHRTILDTVRTLLIDTKLPKPFWAEMAAYAAYVRNRVPRDDTGKAPQEMWTGRPCTQTQIRAFGSTVYVRDHQVMNKLEPRAIRAMLVGYQSYSETTIRFYDPVSKKTNYSRDFVWEDKDIVKPTEVLRGTDLNPLTRATSSKNPSSVPRSPSPEILDEPCIISPPPNPFQATVEDVPDEEGSRPASVSSQADSGPALPGRVTQRGDGASRRAVDAGRHLSLAPTVSATEGTATRDPPETVISPALGSGDLQAFVEDEMNPLDDIEPDEAVVIPPKPKTVNSKQDWELTKEERGKFLGPQPDDKFASYVNDQGVRVMPRSSELRNRGEAHGMAAIPEDTDIIAVLDIQHPDMPSLDWKNVDSQAKLFALLAATEYFFCLVGVDVPKTFRQARNSPDWEHWYKAILAELSKMKAYDVWEIVIRDKNMRVLSARWVFTRKVNGDTGEVAAYKARWVARGYRQIEGIDFNEIFASVAHKDTIRVFLAIVNYYRMHCDQVDIEAAFLHGRLDEEILLEPPEGSGIPSDRVLKLKKSLYGLKQSPRCFNDKLDAWLKSQGCQPSSADPCLYTHVDGDKFLMITLHVDDQLIACNDRQILDQFKTRLNAAFKCTDHGPVKYFLGFNVIRDVENRRLTISQEHYVESVLEKFNMSTSKPEKTPLPANFQPQIATDAEHLQAKHHPYPAIVGSVMYAAAVSRPDLAFAANMLARYITKWSLEHYRAAKHLLRYLRGTADLGLTFDVGGDEQPLTAMVDADWGGCAETRRSTTGYLSFVFGSLIGWRSKRQPTVALSTMEAELMAGCDVTKQVLWLRRRLGDLRIVTDGPTPILCDNQGAIQASANPGQHDRRKHIDIRANFVLENVRGKTVVFKYVPTEENTADMLTKSLDKLKVDKFSHGMGLRRSHLLSRDQATSSRGGML
jgi:hypothetical protein